MTKERSGLKFTAPTPECTTGLSYADGRPIPDEAWPECYDGGSVGKYKPTLEQMEWDLRFARTRRRSGPSDIYEFPS
jgi:hypothetical protein